MGFYNHWVIFVHNLKNVFRFILNHIKLFWLLFIPLFIIIILTCTNESEAYSQPSEKELLAMLTKAQAYMRENVQDYEYFTNYVVAYDPNEANGNSTGMVLIYLTRNTATNYIRPFTYQGVTNNHYWQNYGYYFAFIDTNNTSSTNPDDLYMYVANFDNSNISARCKQSVILYNNFDIPWWTASGEIRVPTNELAVTTDFTITSQTDLALSSYDTPFWVSGESGMYTTYDLCTLYIGYCPSSSYIEDHSQWQTNHFLLTSDSPYITGISLDYTYTFNIPSRDLLPRYCCKQ